MQKEMNHIYFKLAEVKHLPPTSSEEQAVISEWYRLLSQMGSYSSEALKGLGELYVANERFTNNY